MLVFPLHCGFAQSEALIAVGGEQHLYESFDTTEHAKFQQAEQALLEGLSRQTESAAPLAPSTSTAPKGKAIPTTITRKKSPAPSTQGASPAPSQSRQSKVTSGGVGSESTPAEKVGAVAILQKKLTDSEVRVRALELQLSEAKSQLSAAEVEIERLSSIIGGGSARARVKPSEMARSGSVDAQAPAQATPAVKVVNHSPPRPPTNDLEVATITVDKAELRLGPGKNHSALMTLRQGSRLAVEARQGEWYRVFAPNGQRAWIHSSLVRFGEGSSSLNDGSSVRVKGYEASVEQDAFKRAQGMMKGNR